MRTNRKKTIWWIALLAGLVAVNILASVFHQRFDLTEEKRYSLSKPTREMLSKLREPVRIEVFLEGEFPAGFRKLANGVREFLQECKEYGGANIQYSFTDPLAGLDDSAARYVIDSIGYVYRIPAFTLQAPSKVGDEQTQKLVLPGALIRYRDTTIGVNLLQGEQSFGTEPEQLAALYNNVEASMEYKFASAIQKITLDRKPLVGYALGHGEGWGYNVDDVVRTLIANYDFDTVNIRTTQFVPQFDALVIVKPTQAFTDEDKIKIDQYVMHGGKVFWMIDNMYAEFDSLYKSQGFIAFDRGLNLEDILFNYGVRINQALLQDMQNDKLPQVSNNGSGQMRLVDWPFFPVLNGTDHPISKNLDGVRALFPSVLDTVESGGIKKTVLLQSSPNARILETPARVDFEFLQIAPSEELFRRKNVPVGVLLEGNFVSHYTGRIPRGLRDSMAAMNYPYINRNQSSNKMIVVADGDLAMNQFSNNTGPLQMGQNLYTNYTFANKDFFLNAMDYLVNPTDILQTRAKEYTLRLLDPRRTSAERTKWQVINIVLPVLLVILFGFIYQQVRRQQFGSNKA
ncbi:MAG TPA: gliding motility-associated ABC transporter substrate-binding protein GldG [Flavisolibacter sp.]|nr:gliding motility-associated ABC transporter substrate-binding protein GldG [Flavisolibacter sp.]